MSELAVAKRYAVALFKIAKEQNLLNQMEDELQVVKEIFSNQKEFISFLEHPKLSKIAKKEVITNSFSELSKPVLNTLYIMLDGQRTGEMKLMAEEFIQLANEENSIAEATVYTVRLLTATERETVSTAFAAKVGKRTLKINNIADSSILGGIKLQIGNRIYDGSVSGKLDRLSKQLLS